MIKIEHTLFALPFAFLGAVLAANGLPSPWQVLWIVVAMVGARSAAMAFNRIADRRFDAKNPRTAMRALPAGLLSVGFVWARGGDAEPPDTDSRARSSRLCSALLFDQALDTVLASRARCD